MKLLNVLFLVLLTQICVGQKYVGKNGNISFFSETPVENIEAKSKEAAAAFDASTGDLIVQIPIKSFQFEQSLMQEHFNENYLESDKYPKAILKGNIFEAEKIDYNKDASYKVVAKGKMTIHGVTKDITVPGTLKVSSGKISIDAKFNVRCADYDIKIPKLVMVKIAEEIQVSISSVLSKI